MYLRRTPRHGGTVPLGFGPLCKDPIRPILYDLLSIEPLFTYIIKETVIYRNIYLKYSFHTYRCCYLIDYLIRFTTQIDIYDKKWNVIIIHEYYISKNYINSNMTQLRIEKSFLQKIFLHDKNGIIYSKNINQQKLGKLMIAYYSDKITVLVMCFLCHKSHGFNTRICTQLSIENKLFFIYSWLCALTNFNCD